MDLLLLPALAVCLFLMVRLVHYSVEGQVAAFGALLGGWRPDGWPVGVQEEDRDRPWGRSPVARRAPEARARREPPRQPATMFEAVQQPVPVKRLRPVVRGRS